MTEPRQVAVLDELLAARAQAKTGGVVRLENKIAPRASHKKKVGPLQGPT